MSPRVLGPAPQAVRCATALVAALVAAIILLPSQLHGEERAGDERSRLSSGNITVAYDAGDVRPATRILEVAAERESSVAAGAGLESLGPILIFVASSDADFETLTYGGVPDWGAGCAFPERGIVVLRNPLTAPDPLHMEDVVVHEMAHVAAGRVLGNVAVPRWFHEGIAMTIAGEWRLPRSSLLVGAGASGALIPLSELRRGFPAEGGAALLAYTESFYGLNYLLQEAGATPGQMLAAVAEAGSFEAAVSSMTGRNLGAIEQEAMASFHRRFGWAALFSRWENRFALVAVIVVIGGALRLRRRRIRLREMAEEEAGGPTLRERQFIDDRSRWS